MKSYAILPLLVLGLSACDKQGEVPTEAPNGKKIAAKSKSSDSDPAPSAEEKAKEERRAASPRPALKRKPEPEPKPYPVAAATPGQKGFVTSPYGNKIIDVRDIPPGTLVQDPTAPEGEQRLFRVPDPNQ